MVFMIYKFNIIKMSGVTVIDIHERLKSKFSSLFGWRDFPSYVKHKRTECFKVNGETFVVNHIVPFWSQSLINGTNYDDNKIIVKKYTEPECLIYGENGEGFVETIEKCDKSKVKDQNVKDAVQTYFSQNYFEYD
jgi:hypothetical protein